MDHQYTTRTLDLIIATGNPGKIRELSQLLAGLPVTVRGLSDFENITEVEETGSTFSENAILKARGYALQTGAWTLADDSGLEVDALGKAPGVYSARFGGENSSFDAKMNEILAQLEQTGDNARRARFVCSMALANEIGEIMHVSEGKCEGRIGPEPRGSNGFGYDPIFIPDGFDGTFGELSDDIKQQISHRARAVSGIIRYLLDFKAV